MAHRRELRGRALCVRLGLLFNRERARGMRADQTDRVARADGRAMHAGARRLASEDFTHEGRALRHGSVRVKLGIVRHGQPDARHRDVARIEARVHFQEPSEAPQQKPRGYDQHERAPFPPSFKFEVRSGLEACKAGTSPNSTPVNNDTAKTKRRTPLLKPTSCSRGMSAGTTRTSKSNSHTTASSATAPPARERRRLSVKS